MTWLSCEPMMERLTFDRLGLFDWVVMGGSSSSTQTPEYVPPFEDTVHLYLQAKAIGLPVYFKTNLGMKDECRVREYPKVIHTTQLKRKATATPLHNLQKGQQLPLLK